MTRSFTDRVLGGVCGGLASRLRLNAWLLRIIFIIGAIATLGLVAVCYMVLWALLPQESLIAPARFGFLRFIGLLIVLVGFITLWWAILTTAYAPLLAQIPAGIADFIGRAMPVLLILIGLILLLRGRIPLGGIASIILSVGLVGGVAMVAYSDRAIQISTDQDVPIAIAVDSTINLLVVNVSAQTTEITINTSLEANSDEIIGRFLGSLQSTITTTENISPQGIGEYTITETKSTDFPSLNALGRGTLELTIPYDMPLVLNVVNQDGNVTLNLGDAQLERLTLSVVSGTSVVALPAHAPLSLISEERPNSFNLSAGDLTLFIPNTVDARLFYASGGIPRQTTLPDTYFEAREAGLTTLRPNPDIFINTTAPRLYYEISVPNGVLRVQLREEN